MALKPCRECGKEVSDQAEICPNCGIKEPAAGVTVNPPSSQNRPDDVILTMANVIITRTLAKFPSQTFPINGIGSVTLTAPRRGGWIALAVVMGLMALMTFSGGSGGGGFFFLVLCGVFAAVAMGKQHGLYIRTASSDTRAMEGNSKTLNQIKDAIEKAATIRG